MKRINWLALSVVLNLALAGVVVLMLVRVEKETENSAPADSTFALPDAPAEAPVRSLASQPAFLTGDSQLNLVNALRAAAVPEGLIAKVVLAEFESRWWKHQQELQKQFERGDADEDALWRFMDRRDSEQEKAMRAALGEEAFRLWHKGKLLAEFDLAALELSPSETEALYSLRWDWEREKRRLEAARGDGAMDEREFEDQIQNGQTRFTQQLKTLVGEERYARMEETPGETAHLRRTLRGMNATEAQMNELLAAGEQWESERASLHRQVREGKLGAEDFEKQIQALNETRQRELLRVLGEEGVAGFQRETDGRYQTMKRFAPAWGLQDSDIHALYGAIQYQENSIRNYRQQARLMEERGQAVDWVAVEAALRQFSQQTEATLRAYLGEHRFAQMKRNNVFAADE